VLSNPGIKKSSEMANNFSETNLFSSDRNVFFFNIFYPHLKEFLKAGFPLQSMGLY